MPLQYQDLEVEWSQGFWDWIQANPDKPWDWFMISRNINITWKTIMDNPNQPCDWEGVSQNSNSTWEIIQNNPDKP